MRRRESVSKTAQELASIASSVQAPFIAAASPDLFGLRSWRELPGLRDRSPRFQRVEFAAWNSLREAEQSRFIGLTLPRLLAGGAYGPENPVDEFEFEEKGDTSGHTWMNAAYAMAANMGRDSSPPDIVWDGMVNADREIPEIICVKNGDAELLSIDLEGEFKNPGIDMTRHDCEVTKLQPVSLAEG